MVLNKEMLYHNYFSTSVFPSVVKKSKNENIQDNNFACDFAWVRNPVTDTKRRT
jgi:hypothetical protein